MGVISEIASDIGDALPHDGHSAGGHAERQQTMIRVFLLIGAAVIVLLYLNRRASQSTTSTGNAASDLANYASLVGATQNPYAGLDSQIQAQNSLISQGYQNIGALVTSGTLGLAQGIESAYQTEFSAINAVGAQGAQTLAGINAVGQAANANTTAIYTLGQGLTQQNQGINGNILNLGQALLSGVQQIVTEIVNDVQALLKQFSIVEGQLTGIGSNINNEGAAIVALQKEVATLANNQNAVVTQAGPQTSLVVTQANNPNTAFTNLVSGNRSRP